MKAFVDVSKKLAQGLPFICIFAWLFVLYRIKDIKCKMYNTIAAVSIMDAKNVAKNFAFDFFCYVRKMFDSLDST